MNRNIERGNTTRDRLVDVATRLFTEQGYDGTSIEAVLREAGISRGSLYHHFPGKDALFGAALERVEQRVAELTEATPDVRAAR
jgi:AcrR family transcriptional regulator